MIIVDITNNVGRTSEQPVTLFCLPEPCCRPDIGFTSDHNYITTISVIKLSLILPISLY